MLLYTQRQQKQNSGFTLIELLVVIAIIGVLASAVLASLSDSRTRAQTTTAAQQLVNVRTGIFLLYADTGKAPNGCPFGSTANPEVFLNTTQAGLTTRPTAADNTGGCIWTAAEVAAWNGPYINIGTDPWGRAYQYDPDYVPLRTCPGEAELPVIPAVVSFGPDGLTYSCDDIYLSLRG